MKSHVTKVCPVCQGAMAHMFNALVLRRYTVGYFRCDDCGFITTEDPYWLGEAYTDAIVAADTGVVQRNLAISEKLSVLLYYGFDPCGRYVDIAGGYGMLVRLMRDVGFDFYWEDKHCRNEFARGFEANQWAGPFTALTAFEVLEHVADPCAWLSEKLRVYGAQSIICTTETYEGVLPPGLSWWYYSFETGQHISFYQRRTLQIIAERLGLRYWDFNGLHVLSGTKPKNSVMLKALSGHFTVLLSLYVKRRMVSKTFTDHQVVLNQPADFIGR